MFKWGWFEIDRGSLWTVSEISEPEVRYVYAGLGIDEYRRGSEDMYDLLDKASPT